MRVENEKVKKGRGKERRENKVGSAVGLYTVELSFRAQGTASTVMGKAQAHHSKSPTNGLNKGRIKMLSCLSCRCSTPPSFLF